MEKLKILFVFAFTSIFSVSVQSQKISFDRIERDNIRHIGAEKLEMKVDGATYDFSLTVFSGQRYKDYCLLISSIWRIEDNCIMMVKLGNEEIVKLVANNVNVGQLDYPKYEPIIGGSNVSGLMSTQKVDYYVSIYSLGDNLLNKIEQYGIIKIRIAFFNTYHEKNWNNDKLGKFIKKSHIRLEEQLKKPHISTKSIENGF